MERPTRTLAENRRQSQRRKPRTSIRVECRKGALGLGPNVSLEFRNLSETGLQILAKVEFRPKDEAEILLTGFGMRSTIKRLAEVRWVQPLEQDRFLVGLHFQKAIPFRDVHTLTAPDQV